MPARCITRAVLPRYSERRGWTGGSSSVLYAFQDRRTGKVSVRPGRSVGGIGPEVDVRVATRAEATKHWQDPLHSGWKVKC